MKTLIVHMGAHRCGSTAVQTMLARERTVLKQQGIGVQIRRDTGANRLDMRRLHRFSALNPLWHIKLKQAARQIPAFQEDTAIVSDENLMGTMPGVRGHGFYPHFEALVQALVQLKRNSGDTLTIAPRMIVRRQDHFLESVYAFRVSRGMTMGFDDFVRAARQTPLSWLRLAQTLQAASDRLSPKIAVIEGWPKPTAADKALAFLIGPGDLALSNHRLTGNSRYSATELRFMLALNRAGINWRKLDGVPEAMAGMANHEAAKGPGQLAGHLSRDQLQHLEARFSPVTKLQFSGAERRMFLSDYENENRLFFSLPLVVSGPESWQGYD